MIHKAIVIEAMEEAIEKSARNRYAPRTTSAPSSTPDRRLVPRVVEVVEEVEDYFKQVHLEQGGKLDKAKLGDFIVDPATGRSRPDRRAGASR